jgi:putative phosphoribosyl transferase
MFGSPAPYRDRVDAGHVLARSLTSWQDLNPLIIGIPRGGVVVAAAVAETLGAELDAVIVRKVGAPHQPELAVGAVAPTGQVILDRSLIDRIGISERTLTTIIEREQTEAKRRVTAYRDDRPPLDVRDRVAIVVDDGLATGSTMAIALQVLRTQQPRELIAAAPVGSQYAIDLIEPVADRVICPLVPADLMAVGLYYSDFGETSDETVHELLRRGVEESRRREAGREGAKARRREDEM